ncbi:outer membrane beta-barrel protein [Flavobacterium sp.]|uniref:outer membrane beta-barrel protein n=1 Tax=Flavobacterium sp. TaxID=239 RepID=UPI0039E2CEB5
MNLKLLLLCFFASVFSMQAQKNGTLSGKVTDKNNAPISYASIVLKEAGKIITGGISDDNGNYDIKNLEPKNYTVEIQFIGYKTFTGKADFTTGQRSISLGKTVLEEEATELTGVNIVNEHSTIEQKIDRKVITVGKDLTTAGATASDIMNNIPSVNVDQDGKLSLRGNENVRVLIDGKPTNIDASQLLKQIPSSSIKKIELITNPSAKYNPEGMSGIINIVLHKNANDGFNASVNTGVTIAVTPKYNGSIDMNYRKGKVNFFGNYGTNFGNKYNEGYVYRKDSIIEQILDMKNADKNHLFKVGMDYYINDRNTVSVYTNQNFFSGDGDIKTDYLYWQLPGAVESRDKYLTKNNSGAYNLAFKHVFPKEGHTLDFEVNHNITNNDKDIYFNSVNRIGGISTLSNTDLIEDDRQQTTINLDYVNPLSAKSTLELGAESRTIRTDNIFRSTRTSSFDYNYDLDIYSAYATFGQKFEKISYQLGARLESYKVDAILNGATAYKDDYITVYPSAYLTYTPSEKNSFQISYSRRVDRPSLEQTKPSPEFATLKLTSIGNPQLDPQFTNSVEVNYTRTFAKNKGSVTGGVFYRLINDEISRILYPDPQKSGNQIMTFDNYDNNTAFGFEVSANYKINSWWDVQPAIDYSALKQKGAVAKFIPNTQISYSEIEEVDANAFNARLNSNFKATKNIRFNLFGFYRGGVEGIQFTSEPMYKIDGGVRFSMLSNKASLSVRFNDIFNTMQFGFDGDNPYPQSGYFTWESQSIFIGFNYMFGGGKNRALQRKQRDDNTKQNSGGLF